MAELFNPSKLPTDPTFKSTTVTTGADIGPVGNNKMDAALNVVSYGKVMRLGGVASQRFIQFTNIGGTAEYFFLGTDPSNFPVLNLASANTFTIADSSHSIITAFASGGTVFGDGATDPGTGNVVVKSNLTANGTAKLGNLPTLASLPAANTIAGQESNISNPATGKAPKVISDGTNLLYMDGTIARNG